MDFTHFDYQSIRPRIFSREISCHDITAQYLVNIDKSVHLNAFLSVFQDRALTSAAGIDRKIAAGTAGKLAGMVVAVKDILNMGGQRTTCGSKILENYISPYNATVIDRLVAEDAIIIGKTNLDEFAMGSSNENSAYGPVRNPIDPIRVPGGSSGGSAAAVAAHLCMTALGSDTGGSIRQPAAFCGVVGLKPTYGRVSRFGLVAYASSLDQIGPMTRSVADAAHLLQVIAGHDPYDSTSAPQPVEAYSDFLNRSVAGLKIGIPEEYFSAGLDTEVQTQVKRVIDLLKVAGAEIVPMRLQHTEYAIATYYIVATAEASANLARYDGVKFGHRDRLATNLDEMYYQTRSQAFGPEVKRRIMLGTFVLSSGYYDAYYRNALKVRTLIKRDFDEAFSRVDCLLTPTTPTTAFKLQEKLDDPLTMYLSDIYTVSTNLAGLPAMSLPCGKDSKGLPVGVQLIGKLFGEATLFQVADFIEKNLATDN